MNESQVNPSPRFWNATGRFLLLRPTTVDAGHVRTGALVASAVVLLVLWIGFDRLVAGPGTRFHVYGFLGVGWYASVTLLLAALWSRLSQPAVPFRNTLALALAFTPIAAALAAFILYYLPERGVVAALLILALYASLYVHTALRSFTSRLQPRAMLAGFIALSLAFWFAYSQYVVPQFWFEDDDFADAAEGSQYTPARSREIESQLFSQAALIDEAIEGMQRPAEVPAAAFFVGFAGMGEEKVFAGEIALAERVISEKFGATERSLQLVNDRRDISSHPFASTSALRHALAGIAAHMNPDEDVLFLALSSHGSEDGEFEISNPGLLLNNLTPDELADILDESGIRWRVVIVSACYSGQFIEPLRDDSTIVITASAGDKTSFGCSDARDLTYFGEAFYRDALPSSPDLRTAFQRARAGIERREAEEGIEASEPQAHFGPGIERHLRKLGAAASAAPAHSH